MNDEPSRPVQAIDKTCHSATEALKCLIADGSLITGNEFARRRGWTPLDMHRARSNGHIFSIPVEERDWFVAALTALPERFMGQLVDALRPLSPAECMVFMLQKHGSLQGLTVLGAFQQSPGGHRILEVARDLLDEVGEVTSPSRLVVD